MASSLDANTDLSTEPSRRVALQRQGRAGQVRASPSSTALAEALGRFSRGIGAYCRLVIAETDEDDEKSIAPFMSAMAPIDAHRGSSRGGTGEDGVDVPSSPSAGPVEPKSPDHAESPKPDTTTKPETEEHPAEPSDDGKAA
jgi:hypothetical protein